MTGGTGVAAPTASADPYCAETTVLPSEDASALNTGSATASVKQTRAVSRMAPITPHSTAVAAGSSAKILAMHLENIEEPIVLGNGEMGSG
ncbi:MAG: hypothetical protein MUE49_14235 [Rhodospirillales bacterium]|nr:hypothetical protein [Rhodospirillales bacterium]